MDEQLKEQLEEVRSFLHALAAADLFMLSNGEYQKNAEELSRRLDSILGTTTAG